MSAGTLTLTNNSAAVAGNGTAFTTEVAAGDFIVVTVGGVPYTLPVKTVNSNTSLTLVSNYTGPTQSGAAWSAVPRVALNMVTAALVAQSAEALRGLNYDKQNWQQVFSASGMITVKLPDGSTFPGPSWKYLSDNMATKSGGAVPVGQGGTGATNAADARTNLGLGTAAKRAVGGGANQIPDMGFFQAIIAPGNTLLKFPFIDQYGNARTIMVQLVIIQAAGGVDKEYPLPYAFPNAGLFATGNRGNQGYNAAMNVQIASNTTVNIQNWAPSEGLEGCWVIAVGW